MGSDAQAWTEMIKPCLIDPRMSSLECTLWSCLSGFTRLSARGAWQPGGVSVLLLERVTPPGLCQRATVPPNLEDHHGPALQLLQVLGRHLGSGSGLGFRVYGLGFQGFKKQSLRCLTGRERHTYTYMYTHIYTYIY